MIRTTDEAKRGILALIAEKQTPTLYDVQQLAGGDGNSGLNATRSIVLWRGLSTAAVYALKLLQKEGAVVCVTTGPETYLLGGAVLDLPVVKTGPNGFIYDESPHWAPTVLTAGPKFADVAARLGVRLG